MGAGPRVVFYPGSSIGNFAPVQALDFLRQAREVSQGGALLIGVDLVKPVSVLEPAYDDALGVTAAFNRNMLLHLNHLLGSNFDIAHWRHRDPGLNVMPSRPLPAHFDRTSHRCLTRRCIAEFPCWRPPP